MLPGDTASAGLLLQQGCLPDDPAMVRLLVGAYSRQMGTGSITVDNYKHNSFKCPWNNKWIQAAVTLYVGDAADNLDAPTNAMATILEA
eukprot:1245257-Pyramimonas_sp.AAC.1